MKWNNTEHSEECLAHNEAQVFPNINTTVLKVKKKALSRGVTLSHLHFGMQGGWIIGENIGSRQMKRLSQEIV